MKVAHKSLRPSPWSQIAVTSCHDYWLTSSTPTSGCGSVKNNLSKISGKLLYKICMLSFCYSFCYVMVMLYLLQWRKKWVIAVPQTWDPQWFCKVWKGTRLFLGEEGCDDLQVWCGCRACTLNLPFLPPQQHFQPAAKHLTNLRTF